MTDKKSTESEWDIGTSAFSVMVSKFIAYQSSVDVPIDKTESSYLWGNIESWIINTLELKPTDFARIKISVELIDKVDKKEIKKSIDKIFLTDSGKKLAEKVYLS